MVVLGRLGGKGREGGREEREREGEGEGRGKGRGGEGRGREEMKGEGSLHTVGHTHKGVHQHHRSARVVSVNHEVLNTDIHTVELHEAHLPRPSPDLPLTSPWIQIDDSEHSRNQSSNS